MVVQRLGARAELHLCDAVVVLVRAGDDVAASCVYAGVGGMLMAYDAYGRDNRHDSDAGGRVRRYALEHVGDDVNMYAGAFMRRYVVMLWSYCGNGPCERTDGDRKL